MKYNKKKRTVKNSKVLLQARIYFVQHRNLEEANRRGIFFQGHPIVPIQANSYHRDTSSNKFQHPNNQVLATWEIVTFTQLIYSDRIERKHCAY